MVQQLSSRSALSETQFRACQLSYVFVSTTVQVVQTNEWFIPRRILICEKIVEKISFQQAINLRFCCHFQIDSTTNKFQKYVVHEQVFLRMLSTILRSLDWLKQLTTKTSTICLLSFIIFQLFKFISSQLMKSLQFVETRECYINFIFFP